MNQVRCGWAGSKNPRMIAYHDEEWGLPCHDETRLFELINLEGAQAGLSWETILNKRESYRAAFDGWDTGKIAGYGDDKIAELLANPGIVRNRLKVAATISNARTCVKLREESSGLDEYLWGWLADRTGRREPVRNAWTSYRDAPAKTPLSDALSKDLAKRGFKFVGSTIVYAYMQAIGMVNDHSVDCFRYREVGKVGRPTHLKSAV